jgi:hypothetical protein
MASTQNIKTENFNSRGSNSDNVSSHSQKNLRVKIEEMRRIQNTSNILSKTTSADGGNNTAGNTQLLNINNFSKALEHPSDSDSSDIDKTEDIIAPSIEESYREST